MCMSNTSPSLPLQGVIYTEGSKEGTVYLGSEVLVFVSIIAPLSLYICLSACVFEHVPKIAFTTCVMISE